MAIKVAKSVKIDPERKRIVAYTYLWRKEIKMTKGMVNGRRGKKNQKW